MLLRTAGGAVEEWIFILRRGILRIIIFGESVVASGTFRVQWEV